MSVYPDTHRDWENCSFKKIKKLPRTSTYHERYSNLGGLRQLQRTPLSVYSVTDKEWPISNQKYWGWDNAEKKNLLCSWGVSLGETDIQRSGWYAWVFRHSPIKALREECRFQTSTFCWFSGRCRARLPAWPAPPSDRRVRNGYV